MNGVCNWTVYKCAILDPADKGKIAIDSANKDKINWTLY